jgi:AcrR family transcriptional regulator
MEEIARTAGVGKDTLYRRWSSKSELVRHLLTVLAEENVPVPVEDDPHYGLFVFLQDIVRFNVHSDFGAIVAGMVGESARNPELADAFRDFWTERRRIAAELVTDIIGPHATEQDIDRAVDHVVGPIYYRLLLAGGPLDDEYLWDLVTGISWHGPVPKSPGTSERNQR